PEVVQHFRNAAHAGAADADEMHATKVLHDVAVLVEAARDHAATPRHTSAMRTAASGLARVRAACAIVSKRVRSPSNSPSRDARRSALASLSGNSSAAPASTHARAFAV